jgi:MarR-like DNA-binding transcriptional regulator SgrR of sgrS sRNA
MAKLQEVRNAARLEREDEAKAEEEESKSQTESGGAHSLVARRTHEDDAEAFREQLADVIERINKRQRREQEGESLPCSFGPSFDLPFSPRREDETD